MLENVYWLKYVANLIVVVHLPAESRLERVRALRSW